MKWTAAFLAALVVLAPLRGAEVNFAALSAEEFARLPQLQEKLNLEELDRALLAAAIFHESNRVRSELGLRRFAKLTRLDDAAETQANIGAIFRPPSHTNPFPMIATPVDRVRQVGLNPKQVAENIALLSVYNVPSGTNFYISDERDGRLRDLRTGDVLEHHTYESFAAAVVQAWMNSRSHRANMVNPELTHLGSSTKATQSMQGVGMVFAVQVFYTPHRRSKHRD